MVDEDSLGGDVGPPVGVRIGVGCGGWGYMPVAGVGGGAMVEACGEVITVEVSLTGAGVGVERAVLKLGAAVVMVRAGVTTTAALTELAGEITGLTVPARLVGKEEFDPVSSPVRLVVQVDIEKKSKIRVRARWSGRRLFIFNLSLNGDICQLIPIDLMLDASCLALSIEANSSKHTG